MNKMGCVQGIMRVDARYSAGDSVQEAEQRVGSGLRVFDRHGVTGPGPSDLPVRHAVGDRAFTGRP